MAVIIPICDRDDDYAVYAPGRKGEYNTSMVFRGRFSDCIAFRRAMRA